jgi:hypothetical protein
MRAFVGVVEAKSSELDKFNREGEQKVVEQDAVIGTRRTLAAKPANDQQLSVSLSVKKDDPTILTALIDRTASQKRILDDLRRALALPDLAVPYRELEPGIVEAITKKVRENTTFEEASIYVFGNPDFAGRIRYWRNRWGLQ